jgi:chemotaxis protein MotB
VAKDDQAPIIIKKVIKKVSGGAHGGAWKVAYADFVTAMMAFFMLLWLLNVSEKETLEGLADFFTPTTVMIKSSPDAPSIDRTQSGPGRGAGDSIGRSGNDSQIATTNDSEPAIHVTIDTGGGKEVDRFQDAAFADAAERINQAIQKVPELLEHKDQIQIEITEEGMKIQLMDKDRRPMFRDTTAEAYGYAQRLIQEVGKIVEGLPNRISLLGHTDGGYFQRPNGYGNWELSADRANVARQILRITGVSTDRFSEVIAKADTDPIYPDDPMRAENRRITILVIREAPVVPPNMNQRDN